jgi:hypothetical protein
MRRALIGLPNRNINRYRDQDWDKYGILFSLYLYNAYFLCKKYKSFLTEAELRNLKLRLVHNFLRKTI